MIKTASEIDLMRQTCKLAAKTLEFIKPYVQPGISTLELNDLCHDFIIANNAIPSPLNYRGFPKSICTSLNGVVCHGIPTAKDILKNGDILNIDVTTYLGGFHGDTSQTFLVGQVTAPHKKLVDTCYNAMLAGIHQIKPGARLGDIGAVIEEVAHSSGFSVVQEYCGHGIGRNFHEEPQILHFGKRGTGLEMVPGMIFTVEPMINLGRRYVQLLDDKWTVITQDRSFSAQFEHTVLVTDTGYEILTLRSDEIDKI